MGGPPEPIRVAVVDDDRDILLLLGMAVKGHPWLHLTGSFSNGDEARAADVWGGTDVAIIDLMMPGDNDGSELALWMKGAHPNVKRILFSAVDSPEVLGELEVGTFDITVPKISASELPMVVLGLFGYEDPEATA